MLLQGGQGTTCRSLLSPPMTWVPSTKFRVQGWQQAPLPTESGCQSDMSNIKNFYYCYEHFSREQNRIQIQNHSLCLHTNYMGLESIHDKKKRLKEKEGKEKINSMKTSTIFLLTRSKVLLQQTRVQANLWISRMDKHFSFTLIGRTTTQLFPQYQNKLREDWKPGRKGFLFPFSQQ